MIYNPVYRMETLRKIADRIFSGWDARQETGYDTAPVNIYEGADGYLIQIAAPGVKAGDVSVNFSDDILTVAVKRTVETESSEDKKLLRSERGNYDFTRSFSLTNDVDPEKIDAKVLNGFLLLHLTKTPQSKPKKIDVKVN